MTVYSKGDPLRLAVMIKGRLAVMLSVFISAYAVYIDKYISKNQSSAVNDAYRIDI